MPQVLKYRVENAQVVTLSRQIDYQGTPASVSFQKGVVEALPIDDEGNVIEGGRTFAMEIQPEGVAEFPEGVTITVSVSADAVV